MLRNSFSSTLMRFTTLFVFTAIAIITRLMTWFGFFRFLSQYACVRIGSLSLKKPLIAYKLVATYNELTLLH